MRILSGIQPSGTLHLGNYFGMLQPAIALQEKGEAFYFIAEMDSRTPAEPKPDADQNLAIQLLKLAAPAEVAADFENRLRAGGLGYGDLKKSLFENYWNHFAEARKRRAELAANLDYVHGVLADGATKARTLAQTVLKRARQASGLE